MNAEPARVFVSCEQKRGDEREIADQVKKLLKSLDYEPYVAVYEQSLRSFRETIFEKLRDQTEYFLFIDFRRGKIGDERSSQVSLFSHQELAIASFLALDEDILVFQEQGVKRDGMIGAIQGNAIEFPDRSELLEKVEKGVREKWQNNWRRKLVLEQADNPDCDAVPQKSGTTGFFFHLRVKNRHIRATARNCYAFLRSVTDRETGQAAPFEAAELYWAGCSFPNAIIPPRECSRRFDAVWFDSAAPLHPLFHIFSDWPRSLPHLHGPGSWAFEYEVISENVPGSTITLNLDVGENGRVRFGQSKMPVEITHLLDSQISHFNETRSAGVGI